MQSGCNLALQDLDGCFLPQLTLLYENSQQVLRHKDNI
jgi:hypothetical protein